jgi:SAM-dependent methyltransferase
MADGRNSGTEAAEYTRRLVQGQRVWWKRLLDVQRPYRWNLKRLGLGFTLDVGCGVGRNLENLGGHAIGVDHNPHSVAVCRDRGFAAFTPAEFRASPHAKANTFDALLFAHVAEHMTRAEFARLIHEYAAPLKPGGRLIVITPQEAGFRSDPTHVEFFDFEAIRAAASDAGFTIVREYSFPLPRMVGRFFPYNEFVSIARRFATARTP